MSDKILRKGEEMKERRANIIIITLLISETLFLAPLLLNSVYGAPGSLWVSCGQSGVSVYLDSVYAGDTGSGGTIRVDGLDPGNYVLKLTRVGFKEWSKTVLITDSQTTNVYAYLESGTGSSVTRDEIVSYNAPYGSLRVYSTVSGVTMNVDDEYGGLSGSLVNGLIDGTYTLKLSKLGYKDWYKQISIDEDYTTVVYAYLESGVSGTSITRSEVIGYDSPIGSLRVYSGLSGVDVYVEGEYGGYADSQVNGIVAGVYTLRLSKIGYKDWNKEIGIISGETTTVYAYLETGTGTSTTRSETITYGLSYGSLYVRAGESGASVYLDGEYGGDTSSGGTRRVDGLLMGIYNLTITKPGYKSWSKMVEITSSQTTNVYAYLESGTGSSVTRDEIVSYNAPFGYLRIYSDQSSVSVYVGGEYGGTADSTLNGLIQGVYTLKLSKIGYKDWIKQVSVTTGQTTYVYMSLEPGTGICYTRNETLAYTSPYGSLRVRTGLSSVDIYIGGEYSGLTSSSEKYVNGLIQGIYNLKLKKDGYKEWNKQVLISMGQTTIVYANLEEGSGTSITRDETLAYNSPYGSININTDVNDINIYLNNEYGGVTSPKYRRVEGLIADSYNLTLSRVGCEDWTSQVIITAGQTATVNAEMTLLPCVADFSYNNTDLNIGVPITFLDNSYGVVDSWLWSFGDNQQSTSQNPVHTYSGEGEYTVSLTIQNSINSDTISKTVTIGSATPPEGGTVNPVTLYTPSNPTTSSVRLTWSQSNIADFSKYDILLSQSSGEPGWITATIRTKSTTTYEVTGLASGTTYYFTVRTSSTSNRYADSKQVSITTLGPAPVKAVELGTSDVSTSSVRLNWWTQGDHESFSKYDIFMSQSPGVLGDYIYTVESQSTTSYVVTGLESDKDYYFTVRIKTVQGDYADSNQAHVKTTYNLFAFFDPLFTASFWTLDKFSIVFFAGLSICAAVSYRAVRKSRPKRGAKFEAKAEALIKSNKRIEGVEFYAKACAANISNKNKDAFSTTFQKYYTLARSLLIESVLINNKTKVIDRIAKTQSEIARIFSNKKNEKIIKLVKIQRLEAIENLISQAKDNNLEIIADEALKEKEIEEYFLKELNSTEKISLQELATKLGFSLEATLILLKRNIQAGKITGFVSKDQKTYLSNQHVRKTLLKSLSPT